MIISGFIISLDSKEVVIENAKDEHLRCIFPNKLPLEIGDVIYSVGEIKDNVCYIEKYFICPTLTKSGIVPLFQKMLSKDITYIHNDLSPEDKYQLQEKGIGLYIYEYLATKISLVEIDDNKINDIKYGTEMTTRHILAYLETYPDFGLSREFISSFYSKWRKQRILRRLLILGILEPDIKNAYLDHRNLYEKIINIPLVVYILPLESATFIHQLFTGPLPDLEPARIIRSMYDEYIKRFAWTCVPISFINKKFKTVYQYLEILKEYEVVVDHEALFFQYQHEVEVVVSEFLNKRIVENSILGRLPILEDEVDGNLTDEQRRAVQGALFYKISCITGGAGTGKSTIIKNIVAKLKEDKRIYKMASFTGKAVARIHEILESREARTMDMMIASSELEKMDVLIIDETSMVTTELLYRFIKKFPGDYSVILVGDINQLQPISWGTLMQQCLLSARIPTFRLFQNHRIMSGGFDSIVLSNANKLIIRTSMEKVGFMEGDGFAQFGGGIDAVTGIVKLMYEQGINPSDVTVICPYREEVNMLNPAIQKIFFPYKGDDDKWIVGDRIMMTENNYDVEIMNGEEGVIVGIEKNYISALFRDGIKEINFYFKEKPGHACIEEITHCYAITTHKSQGSEYKYVICYIPRRPWNDKSKFLNSNLLYVMMTRTKKAMWLIGDPEIISSATTRIQSKRIEKLAKRLIVSKNEKVEAELAYLCQPLTFSEEDCIYDD